MHYVCTNSPTNCCGFANVTTRTALDQREYAISNKVAHRYIIIPALQVLMTYSVLLSATKSVHTNNNNNCGRPNIYKL